jgi:hypothetical protein
MTKIIMQDDLPKELKVMDSVVRNSLMRALEKAERFSTNLVIKTNGKIEEITPAEMRRRLKLTSKRQTSSPKNK